MSSPESSTSAQERLHILEIVRRAIAHGLREDRGLPLDPSAHPERLRVRRAAFVTLRRNGELRGCVGSLEPSRSLVEEVAQSAFRAGFRDPRFPPLGADEIDDLEIHVSILSPLEPLTVRSEEELIAKLRPGQDGVLLREGAFQATFLPSVWESLPEARRFVRELKRKAGLPAEHWSDAITVFRYTTESFPHETDEGDVPT